ncbi:peptidase E [Tumebacillus flagellatus]|uniref:Peptidase n=1 Tax=Tumebacillus flagellatus TaxID=1157490 RepID=A0A074LND8_9BACL|nr:peptidase E [Tumebacillus flagellatus]KEO82025.1 peptidase [Tumebacillus flagellatus]
MKKQIIAMGGGGFSMEPDNLLLDEYILAQTGKERPKVCFLPTASGDSAGYTERFYESMSTLTCEPNHLSLFHHHPGTSDLEGYLLTQDVIYVGGGNTRNMIVLWKEWGVDVILRKAWEQGIVLAGLSAGSICWFEHGVTDSVIPKQLHYMNGLGFLPGSNCPHYDGEAERRPTYHRQLREGLIPAGFAADDGAGLHFIGTDLHRVVSSRPNAKGYRLNVVDGVVTEDELDTNYLG